MIRDEMEVLEDLNQKIDEDVKKQLTLLLEDKKIVGKSSWFLNVCFLLISLFFH